MSKILSDEEINEEVKSISVPMEEFGIKSQKNGVLIDTEEYKTLLRDKNRLNFLELTRDKRYATQLQHWILSLHIPNKVRDNFREYLDYVIKRFETSPFVEKNKEENKEENNSENRT